MFKKKQVVAKAQTNRPKVDAVLNRKLKIAGDVYFSGILHVECTIEGDLISDDPSSTLILSDAGHIKGSVRASNVMANGRIDGNVLANNKVELYEKSRINGDLHYNLLEMAVGAGVNGKLVHHELMSQAQAAMGAVGKNMPGENTVHNKREDSGLPDSAVSAEAEKTPAKWYL